MSVDGTEMIAAPRRVAFIIDALSIGGTELNAVRTAEALGRLGVQLDVFHAHADGALLQRWRDTGHRMHHFDTAPLWSPRMVICLCRLRQAILRAGIDVVHTQDIYTNIWLMLIGLFGGLPRVIASRRWDSEVPRVLFGSMNRLAQARSNGVTANSDELARKLATEGVPPRKIAYIPNFIDDAKIEAISESSRSQLRKEFRLRPSDFVYGTVGRLVAVKRHDLLIRGFAESQGAREGSLLMLVGDGPERESLEELAYALGVGERVIFPGAIPNERTVQQAFDCFVLSSDHEGFSNALLEAACCGVACISTRVGGAAELLDSERGSVVGVGDLNALSDALSRVRFDDSDRRARSDRLSRFARSRYSEGVVMGALLAVYQSDGSTKDTLQQLSSFSHRQDDSQ